MDIRHPDAVPLAPGLQASELAYAGYLSALYLKGALRQDSENYGNKGDKNRSY